MFVFINKVTCIGLSTVCEAITIGVRIIDKGAGDQQLNRISEPVIILVSECWITVIKRSWVFSILTIQNGGAEQLTIHDVVDHRAIIAIVSWIVRIRQGSLTSSPSEETVTIRVCDIRISPLKLENIT